MEKNARAYAESLAAVSKILELELDEIHDWNCCGATEYSSLHLFPSHVLVGRNLALAQQQINGTHTLMAACSACYLNLCKTNHYMQTSPELAHDVNDALGVGGLHYDAGSLEVRHLLDILLNDVGLEKIKQSVILPLKGLHVAAYYGCQVPRPDYDHRFTNPEYPDGLEKIFKALGATVIDFPLKTHCCGGHMTQISEATAYELIRRLIKGAAQYQADIMVTLCPMCQLNLDAYQVEMNKYFKTDYAIPVVYFTQLMGLAFGIEAAALGFGREFVDARPALSKIGVDLPPSPDDKTTPRKKGIALPMPHMPEEEAL
jgi:heterodisulfide reductase subunit B